MATNYGERIARMEEKTDNIDKKVDKIDRKQDAILGRLDNLENVFVTRREVTLVKAVIGIGFSTITFYLAYKGMK